MQHDFTNIKTLVVKIGTTLLSNEQGFDGSILEGLVQDLARVKRKYNLNLVIVSSGAMGCGMDRLGMDERPELLRLKQATAAVGQARLMHFYETLFQTFGDGLKTAQVLLSASDLDEHQSYLNVRNTINTLFEFTDIIPIINENDSTATNEIRFGDNDTLSARVAAKIDADLLILLSDVNGLYKTNPAIDPNAELIPHVINVTTDIESFAEDTAVATSIGGMKTKLDAAKIACSSGLPLVIANGHRENIISEVLRGEALMTVFGASENGLAPRKRWIAYGSSMKGTIQIDEGAANALVEQNKSLLPAGMVTVEGSFEPGDAVSIVDSTGREIARGLVNYSSENMQKICGVKTHEIEEHLGQKDYDSVIHRDNLVLM
jgi:glutamate 5-kinase